MNLVQRKDSRQHMQAGTCEQIFCGMNCSCGFFFAKERVMRPIPRESTLNLMRSGSPKARQRAAQPGLLLPPLVEDFIDFTDSAKFAAFFFESFITCNIMLQCYGQFGT